MLVLSCEFLVDPPVGAVWPPVGAVWPPVGAVWSPVGAVWSPVGAVWPPVGAVGSPVGAVWCTPTCRYACYLTLLKKWVGDTDRLEVPMFFGEGTDYYL